MTFHYLDLAIALVVVMLGVSLLITIATQIVAMLLAARGRTLRDALVSLFKVVCPAGAAHAQTIAHDVLTHELISDSALPVACNRIPLLKTYRLASAVRADEVIGVLNHMAQTESGGSGGADQGKTAGAPDKAVTIGELLQRAEATPDFAGLQTWFNTVMDRASQKFLLKARAITIVCSILAAFALHLDTFHLVADASSDPEVRARLVSAAQTLETQAAQTQPSAHLIDQAAAIQASLQNAGLRLIPDPYHTWDFWPARKGFWPWDNLHFWGILVSAALLSLGAPFWFNALKTLSSLRPAVASKLDADRGTTPS